MAFKIGTKIIEILQYAKQLFLHDDFIHKVAQGKHISKQKTAYKAINLGVPRWVRPKLNGKRKVFDLSLY
jgi:hypothetical protein